MIPPAAQATPPAPAVAPPAAPQPEARIRFNFKEAPLDQVLDYFARESGLPIIFEAPVPQGGLTFVGASAYTFDEALSILNLNLAMRGVHLRKQDQFLYLATLQDSMKKAGQVGSEIPAGVTPDQILTITIPLSNAKADVVVEQVKALVGPYGGVVAVPQQNMLIVTETAGQCRRIREIVQSIDAVRPVDSAFKIFPLKHAQADAVLAALKGLVGQRERITFVDKDGKQTTLDQQVVQGLNLASDPRTNSIVAVGPAARIQTVQELVTLLDAPDGGAGEAQLLTFNLQSLAADKAAGQVNSLFANLPEKRRPTVIAMPEAGKLTLVGPASLLAQASALLGEIDPGAATGVGPATPERRTAVVKLTYTTPAACEQLLSKLLTPRQQGVIRTAPSPDGKSLIVSGPAADVAGVEALIAGVDVAPRIDKEVRLVRIASGDPSAVLQRAVALDQQTGQNEADPVSATLDPDSRTVTLVGSRASIARLEQSLKAAQANLKIDLEARTFTLAKVRPSVLAPRLTRLARPLLEPSDGSAYVDPVFEPVDELDRLIVRALPSQMQVIDELVKRLDAEEPGGRELRIVKVAAADAPALIERTQKLYADRTAGMPEDQAGPVSAEYDEKSGNLLISARPAAMRIFTDLLAQAQQLLPPARTTRLLDIQNVKAADVLAPLTELLKTADPIDASRKLPEPAIQVVERTNSLLITAEEAQHHAIEDLVRRLDKLQADLPPMKLLQLRTADAAGIAAMLNQQYGQRPQAERATKPVEVRADAATNTLIVSAHPDLFEAIKSFVEELNKDKKEGPERVTELFTLKVAKAVDVAAAMDKLYPLPPVPVDRQNRPMPWLQQPKEVNVSADAGSNSLIIDAPADRMESLRALAQQLDRVELPPIAQLKTYRVVGADLSAIAQTLQSLHRQGNLSGPAQPGKPPVQVVIETEPKSSTLIIAGDEVTFQRVESVLKDLQAVPVEKGLRVIPVANAKAAEVRQRALAIYDAQVAQIPGAMPIDVTVDEKTNSLMVVAAAEDMQRFMKVMDELQRQSGPAREIRLLELRMAKAADVVAFLNDMSASSESMMIRGGPDPVFEAIETTNAILVAAQPAQFAVVEGLVKSLDSRQAADRPPMRILKLLTSDAANLATVLQHSYDQRPIDQKNKQPVDIQADPATNTLVVTAHPDALKEIEGIVSQLNETQAADAQGREIRIFPLKVARAEELAQTIDQMFPEPPVPLDPRTRQPRPDLKQPREIVVRADRATNALIVDAPAKRLAGFEQIVKSLDQQKLAANVELRTYRVARADLEAVAATLRSLASTNSLLTGPGQATALTAPVTINTEPATRSLIVSGPSEVFPAVENVLQRLDGVPDRPATGLKMYPLKHVRAERLAPLMTKLLATRVREEQELQGKPAIDAQSVLDVAADPASNTLIISAPETVQRIAEELLKTLDADAAQIGRNVIRVIPLSYAEAGQVAVTLNQALPTIDLPSGSTPSITAAPGSNALLLSGVEADLAKVEELIKPLDVRPSGADTPNVQTFALKHADAATIAKTVERLLVDQQETDPRILSLQLQYARQARQDLFKKPAIRVEAEARTNCLIISAPAASLELAKSVIERLDQPSQAPDRTVMTFTPARGDPATLAAAATRIVNATLPQGRVPVELSPEPKTGSIVILGTAEQVAGAGKTLADLDERVPATPAVDLQVIPVANADAAAVATTVQAMLADRSRWPDELKQAEKAGLAISSPVVNADRASNRLLVSVPSVMMPLARQLVATLDQPLGQAAVDVRVFKLQKGQAAPVAAAIKSALTASAKPGEPAVSVTPEPGSNSVVISGSAAALEQSAALIKSMDEAVEPDGMGVRTIYLKFARAESISPVLETVLTRESALDKLPDWMRAQAYARGDVDQTPRVRVAAEQRLNAVVVSGPRATLELAEQVVSELDVDPATKGHGADRPVRIITVRNADAAELATNVQAVFDEDQTGAMPPTIRVDRASNSMIVRASPSQMATIEDLAARLDSATLSTSRQLRMVPIDKSRVDAELLARTLKRLIEQQSGVKVDVVSTDELLKRELQDNDKPAGKPRSDAADRDGRFRVPLSAAPDRLTLGPATPCSPASAFAAWRVAAAFAMPQAGQPAPTGDAGVTIAVDPASNSLLLVGSPRLTDRLVALATELEKQMPAEPVAVRVVTLPQTADAAQIAQLVSQTAQQIGRVGPANPGGFTGPVGVLADPAGAAVIVLANPTDFETVGQLITAVTQVDKATALTVKLYPLASISAARARQAVLDLVSAAPQGQQARRLRSLDVTIEGAGDQHVTGRLDPSLIRVTADPGGASLIVAAPSATLPLIDRFVALIDQSPVADRLSIRRYALDNARAEELSRTLQQLMDAQRQGPSAQELPQARFVADARTNSMLVTASDQQHADIQRILQTADAGADDKNLQVAIITLQQASPSTVQRVVEQVVVGNDPGKKDKIRISADDSSNVFVVRASQEDLAQVRELVSQVDTAETTGLPLRSVKLERADAQSIAAALQTFFKDRAAVSSRPGQKAANRVAVVGDRRSGTLVVSASDEDFAQIQSLVAMFDAPSSTHAMQFKIIPLKHARVADVEPTISNIASQMQWERIQTQWSRRGDQENPDRIIVEANENTNSLVIMGQGDALATAERVIAALDQPPSDKTQMAVKAVKVERADLQAVKSVIERAMSTPGWRPWRGSDPDGVTVELDRFRRALVLVGKSERVDLAAKYVAELDADGAAGNRQIESVTLQHARAERAAQSLRQFFSERARSQGLPDQPVSIIGSQDGNVLIVSADAENIRVLKDLVAQIDQPELSPDRRIEVYALKNAAAADLAATMRAMFPKGSRADEQVLITPQPSTNALVVSAPGAMFDQVDALLKELDAAPNAEAANIATVSLSSARAQEVAAALRSALPPNLKVTITPVVRSNTLLLTGSAEAIDLVMSQIRRIDTEPVRSLLVFRRYKLEAAAAEDVASTIELMLRARPRTQGEPLPGVDYSRTDNTLIVSAPGDQIEDIAAMIKELDVPAVIGRKTEFVKLRFASAEQTARALEMFYGRWAPEAATPGARNVSIVSNTASNALVISADEKEWEGIRSLLDKLDTEDFDTTRQLAVIPLIHADAASVARALNEGFRSPAEEQARAEALRQQLQARPNRNDASSTRILARDAGTTVSAEPLTNALVVFAAREELAKIEAVVKQIDVPGFAKLPEPRVIPLKTGRASAIAQTIREMFLGSTRPGGAAPATTGPRAVVIIGDDTSGALIVRAAEQEFAQIKALADSLQQQGEAGRMTTHVLRLRNVPAARLRQTILTTFTPAAQQMGETIAVEVDRSSNSLVIACSPRLREQIEKVVAELDGPAGAEGENPAPGAGNVGQNIFIVDVENNSPDDIKKMLEQMGLHAPQPVDRPGVVSEPVTITALSTRRAVAILANPADGRAVTDLIKAIDAAPAEADQRVAIVALKLATAAPLVKTVQAMLAPGTQDSQTGPAKALAEQIRRLGLARTGLDQTDLKVDLNKPIRLIPDADTNSVIIASTPANVAALQEVIRVLDTLPIGDAVVIRMFPLENASSVRIKAVIDQLFSQGEALRRLPGTRRQGLPSTATGQALAGEIAVAVDERTNTLIVAGREEAVALVDVLVKDLDSSEVSKWIEPAIIELKYADARAMADRLREVLVRGLSTSPEAIGLQKQYGRLRMLNAGREVSDPGARIEADLFAPLTGLVITADPGTNNLIVVGTPANIAIVRQLIGMLDVEAAAAANEVRVFPLRFAAADRIAIMVRDVFRQREDAGSLRTEDRLVVTADARTNALVASTSTRSFAILESLVRTLDAEQANPAVGLHVIPVSNADVRQLAPKIEKLMRERIEAATRAGAVKNPADAFSVEAEPANNLLIIAASDENFQMVKDLLDALASDASRISGAERAELIPLHQATAADVAASLRELYVDKENARRGGNAVNVIANSRLNAIIVSGTDQDVSAIRGLVARLDGAEVQAVREVRRIELRTANALELVNLLENVLAGRPISGRGLGSVPATKLRFMRDTVAGELAGRTGRDPKEAEVDGAIRDQVTLTPDLRTNSVLIAAPPKMVELIAELINDLDSTSAGSRKIETFKLVNADARAMADLLRDIFNLRQQGNMYVLVPSRAELPAAEGGPAAPPSAPGEILSGTSLTPVPDERQQLSVAIDARTNTLIVSGTEEYLELVRRVVNEIDNIEATERQRIVYPLRHAKAKEMEATLQKYFSDETQLERQTLGPQQVGSLQKQLEEEVTVVGDEKSNKLVVSTSPRYMDRVLKIIKELDSAPPQVMIQVLLAEVTLDSDETWGMDAKFGPFGGDDYVFSHTANGTGVGTSIGVPNFSISSADFGLLIRALAAQGKLEVLSNPQVTVNNNQKASIQVGDNVALPDSVERTPQGGTRSDVSREDIGIILNVTPTISEEGFVRMEINPEISTLSARTTQISEDFSAPVINKRTVDTVVTIKDGQSVVIGGLIQSTEEKRKSKVPFLGDIPILGLPFQTSISSTRKTELLVIVTPRVVPGEGEVGVRAADVNSRMLIERIEDPSQIKAYKRMLDAEQKEIDRTIDEAGRPGPWAPDETPIIEPETPEAPKKKARP